MPVAPEQASNECNIVVALKCEAKPIINHYGLKRDNSQSDWPVYKNNNLALIISGTGKANAEAASYWLHSNNPAPHWLNVGIAGHAHADIGGQWLANTVTDATTQECWNMKAAQLANQPNQPLVTVDSPSGYERDDCLYDMEAAGIMSACGQLSASPNIAIIKIVSDNNNQHWTSVNSKAVSALVADSMPLIETTLDAMMKPGHVSTM